MKRIAALLLAVTFPTAALSGIAFSDMTCTDGSYEIDWPTVPLPSDHLITGLCPTLAEWYDPEFHRQLIRIYDTNNEPFTFVSFQTYDGNMRFTSNTGGHLLTEHTQNPNFEIDPSQRTDPTYILGPAFQDVHWVHLDYSFYGAGDHEQFEFGNFVFGPANPCTFNPTLCPPTTTVSEPATALLLGGG